MAVKNYCGAAQLAIESFDQVSKQHFASSSLTIESRFECSPGYSRWIPWLLTKKSIRENSNCASRLIASSFEKLTGHADSD
jgi:hypothetical protein